MKAPLRILTATTLFDGHDASINIVRRLLQGQGVEVIHLGINRSVHEVVTAALQEDVDAIAISSYQGGHQQYLTYLLKTLKESDADLEVFVGGGGSITLEEARALERSGINRVYTAGEELSLDEMISDLIQRLQSAQINRHPFIWENETSDSGMIAEPGKDVSREDVDGDKLKLISDRLLGIRLTQIELGNVEVVEDISQQRGFVIGVTGTGGAGKSTFIDELLNALLGLYPELRIAYLAVDPSGQKAGGALLGDRIRINTLPHPRLYMRSLATRKANVSLSDSVRHCILRLKFQGFDLILIESTGIGQNDTSIVDLADFSIYLMTKDYGSPSQLEKIAMLQCADAVILNKADQVGSEDAFRDIKNQWRCNCLNIGTNKAELSDDTLPIFPMVASHFLEPGFKHFVHYLARKLPFQADPQQLEKYPLADYDWTATESRILLNNPVYLEQISQQHQIFIDELHQQTAVIDKVQRIYEILQELNDPELPSLLDSYPKSAVSDKMEAGDDVTFDQTLVKSAAANMTASTAADTGDTEVKFQELLKQLRQYYNQLLASLSDNSKAVIKDWLTSHPLHLSTYDSSQKTTEDDFISLSGIPIPHVALPEMRHLDSLLKFLVDENEPGKFPYTGGLFPSQHSDEEPTRMFAGEGTPEDTNRRFHYLIRGQKSVRLSTAFDPNTLYGHDPGDTPDVFGCIGMSGVSIASLDDMKKLYSGIDLCDPSTSVSMTINGPAPIFMAWFLHTAIDQQVEKYLTAQGLWPQARAKIEEYFTEMGWAHEHPDHRPYIRQAYSLDKSQELPANHNGLGLGLLGTSGQMLMEELLDLSDEYQKIQIETFKKVRGTLQADILKEEIAQNECIFSLDFALKLMADMQAYFVHESVQKFYPVSVSGYHIAEAGANPVTQLAFTLANGFTLLEYYLAHGLHVDDVAPKLSFFFSNAMDPEYAVIGRVARRIWSRTLRYVYGANERSQKLKYHIQTSGRSLQALEIDLNDIRTTLQAIYAIYDNCNSLHTNAYDETITTPTEESVYRALSIQAIIQREFGLNKNLNPLQGSFIIRYLTDAVEAAVYKAFEALARRGGVLGGIESGYQRAQIQEQSLYYEHMKSQKVIELVGVNCFVRESVQSTDEQQLKKALVRCSDEQKQQQIDAVAHFKRQHRPRVTEKLEVMQTAIACGHNSFAELMKASPYASLSELVAVMHQVGGKYRRNM